MLQRTPAPATSQARRPVGSMPWKAKLARPAALGVVHGHVGQVDQRLRVLAIVGIHADADAGGQPDHVVADAVRRAQRQHHGVGDADRVRRASPRGQQDQEFVAAVAADTVSSRATQDARRSAARRRIRSPTAWPSVSLICLKLFRSTKQQRKRGALCAGAWRLRRQALQQQGAVGQLRQRIQPCRRAQRVQLALAHRCVRLRLHSGEHQLLVGL